MGAGRNEQDIRGSISAERRNNTANGGNSFETGENFERRSSSGYGRFLEAAKEVSAREYTEIMNNFVNKNPNAGMVDLHEASQWEKSGARMFAGKEDGISFGAAVKPDGDIVGVFSEGGGKGGLALIRAVSEGGNKLDAYAVNPDGSPSGLARIYHKVGFEPVARVSFNADYVSPDWSYGERDIVFYIHNGENAEQVAENYGKYAPPTKEQYDALPIMGYDEALKYRDGILKKRSNSAK